MPKLISIFFILLSIYSLSIENKNDLFNDLKNKIINSEIIAFDFNNDNIKGEIIISKGNKYKIKLNDRIITSNGKIIWNYSMPDKQVLISNFKEVDDASIENLFNNYIAKSKPKSLTSSKTSYGETLTKLTLGSEKDDTDVFLYLTKDKTLTLIELNNDLWEISNLKFDSPLSTTFEFEPDSTLEVIDFR